MTTVRRFLISTSLVAGLLVAVVPGPATAAKNTPMKTTNYVVTLEINGVTTAPPYISTETVTAEIVANPVGSGKDPTAWTGQATLNFGPIATTGVPGCVITTVPPTGSSQVAITKSGESIDVVWSTSVSPLTSSIISCFGQPPAVFPGAPSVEPTAFLEPRQFTLPAAGGTKTVYGKLDAGNGMMENSGTITVTRRTECGQKVKQVNTYPPGQQTAASSMVGKAFAAGEKLTADTKTEFVFEDGSVVRLAKGASIKQDANCEAFVDKSRSFKGTLLLGKIWFHVSKVFGDQVWWVPQERCVTGHRGTVFWSLPGKKKSTLSVSEGSIWISRTKGRKLTGKKVIVKQGHTAVITKSKITVRRLKAKDAFPFG